MSLKDIRPALRAFLLADATIAGLVAARIYPIKMPQGVTATSLVYNEISGDTGLHNEGSDGLSSVRMQLTAWAQTADAAQALYLAVKERLHGYRGAMGSGAAEVAVQLAQLDTWRDLDDTVANLRGKSADYFIWFRDE
jgi:hypothetical protein